MCNAIHLIITTQFIDVIQIDVEIAFEKKLIWSESM